MKLLSIGELKPAKGIPYSRPHLYRLINAGQFPRPVPLSANRIAFVEEEIDAWIKARADQRGEVPA